MQQFSNHEIAELKSRIDQIHDLLAGRGDDIDDMMSAASRGSGRAPELGAATSLLDQLSFSIQVRRIRRSHFRDTEMSGPHWDMMLDLMMAGAHGRVLSASDLATGAGVPLSSGLRMIASLERAGYVSRSIDERDRRRTIVRLTDSGIDQMVGYFEKIGVLQQSRQTLAA